MKHIELYEVFNSPGKKYFTESEVKYYTQLWNGLHFKYTKNPFFSKLWDQVLKNRYLSDKQWTELQYLLKNGRSRYEAGILPSNY